MKLLTQEEIKRNIGIKAASLIEDGMIIGLGSGTTATFFIDSLIERCQAGLQIAAVCTSLKSQKQAQEGGIPLLDVDQVTTLDLTIDGADEIDPKNRMIKGGGGALLREKILAESSKKMLVILDESKLVDSLGKFGLPVEIIPFCYKATLLKIRSLGYEGKMRTNSNGMFYLTDNGNFVFDIHFPQSFINPEMDHRNLVNIAGVVDTGFFFNLPVEVLIGQRDGRCFFREEDQWMKP